MQPSGWIQVAIGLGIGIVAFGVSYLVPKEWAFFVGWWGVALGLGVIVSALVLHYIRREIGRRPIHDSPPAERNSALTLLMVELDGIIVAMKQEVDFGRVQGVTQAERSDLGLKNNARFEDWIRAAVAWSGKYLPEARRIFSLGGEAQRGYDHANLPLAEHYRENFDQIFSNLTGATFAAPMADPPRTSVAAGEAAERPLFLMGFCWKIQPRFFKIYKRSFPEEATLEDVIAGPFCLKCGRLRASRGPTQEVGADFISPNCQTEGCGDAISQEQVEHLRFRMKLDAVRMAVYREAQRLAWAGAEFPLCPTAQSDAIVLPNPDTSVIEPGGGFEFYPGRNHLPDTRSTRAQLEKVQDEMCASWNAGRIVLVAEMLKIARQKHRKRILLPHPEKVAPHLATMEPTSTLEMITEGITKLTRTAWEVAEQENLDIEVRWLTRMPRNTAMLLDPRREDGWAHVELLQPGVPEDLRPICWFTKSRFPALYLELFRAFEAQWAESVDPTWNAYYQATGDRVLFNLAARRPRMIEGARVSVRPPGFPDGALLPLAVEQRGGELGEGRGSVWFEYPIRFSGAPAARSGEWGVRWSVLVDGNWREAVYTTHDICISC